ncbi:MAG: hypothetical protein FWD72_06045, partial [Eggerthellaceae bacterium]|nr:hypothetical protein [Eggerthellaceae bacterium]
MEKTLKDFEFSFFSKNEGFLSLCNSLDSACFDNADFNAAIGACTRLCKEFKEIKSLPIFLKGIERMSRHEWKSAAGSFSAATLKHGIRIPEYNFWQAIAREKCAIEDERTPKAATPIERYNYLVTALKNCTSALDNCITGNDLESPANRKAIYRYYYQRSRLNVLHENYIEAWA